MPLPKRAVGSSVEPEGPLKKAKKEAASEAQQEMSEEEVKEEDHEIGPEAAAEQPSSSAATGAEASSAAPEEMVQILSSTDSEAEPLDPLEPWQRRMVAKKLNQCKDEVSTRPAAESLQCHLLVPAIPNRRKPIKEHHWLSRKAVLCRAPWGLSAGIAGPRTLPADLSYLGQGRNRFEQKL